MGIEKDSAVEKKFCPVPVDLHSEAGGHGLNWLEDRFEMTGTDIIVDTVCFMKRKMQH